MSKSKRIKLVCGLISGLCMASAVQANVGIHVNGATFVALDGQSAFPDNGLMQLINLGVDGVANPITAGNWVGGDDVLIDLPYGGAEFPTSGGFDLSENEVLQPGYLGRTFDFAITPGVLEEGDLLGLRWFPGLTPADFFNDNEPVVGTAYGQARLSNPINDLGAAWVVPAETDPTSILEPLISDSYSQSIGGFYAATPGFDGTAQLSVLSSSAPLIPEPSTYAAFFVFALMLISYKRSWNKLLLQEPS